MARRSLAEMGTDTHRRLMRLLDTNPGMGQRDAARELGVSLGKVKVTLTLRYLQKKMRECEALRLEIEEMRRETEAAS